MSKTNKLIISIGFICLGFLTFGAMYPTVANADLRCSGGNCWYVACNTSSECGTNQFTGAQKCDGNNVYQDYITFTCNNPGTADASCTKLTTSRNQQYCGSDQTCRDGSCIGNRGSGNYTNSNINHLQCSGNSVYWYDQNGYQRNLYQTCNSNQACSDNSCVASNYISHILKGCVNNSVYWYNSQGTQQDLYQNCSLSGQTCQNGACVAVQPVYTQPIYTQPAPIITTTTIVKSDKLSVSILGKNSTDATSWSKEISGSKNETINFLVTVKNMSSLTMDNVLLKADTQENFSVDNIKIDSVQSTGNITSGINLGAIQKGASKIISFDGTVNSADQKNEVKITVSANSGDISDSDSLTINITKSSIATASLVDSPVLSFVKQWYMWAIGIIVLISLFVIIFKRLSSNNV